MNSYVLTPSAGKRLIGMALARHPEVLSACRSKTLVIVAGTTNGYVAEEILKELGQAESFSRRGFYRGLTVASKPPEDNDAAAEKPGFHGDVVIRKGVWEPGKTLFDVLDELREGDVVLKGANALDLENRRAAVLVGHPQGGTVIAILQKLLGGRVRVLFPVGLEKRVPGRLDALAEKANAPGSTGPRLMPAPGEVFSELDAIRLLTGAEAEILAAGGVLGAEGACWLAVDGDPSSMAKAAEIMKQISEEPLFAL